MVRCSPVLEQFTAGNKVHGETIEQSREITRPSERSSLSRHDESSSLSTRKPFLVRALLNIHEMRICRRVAARICMRRFYCASRHLVAYLQNSGFQGIANERQKLLSKVSESIDEPGPDWREQPGREIRPLQIPRPREKSLSRTVAQVPRPSVFSRPLRPKPHGESSSFNRETYEGQMIWPGTKVSGRDQSAMVVVPWKLLAPRTVSRLGI